MSIVSISLSNGWHFLLKNCNNIKEFKENITIFMYYEIW